MCPTTLRRIRRACGVAPVVSALLWATACAPTREPGPRFTLDRPADMVFSCFGDLRLSGGDPDPDDDTPLVLSAQPLASCVSWANSEVPAGQEGMFAPAFAGFVLQSATGTLAVVSWGSEQAPSTAAVINSDPLIPGKSSIPVGHLPIALAADPSGCHVVTANAGSCDLSVLDVSSAMDASRIAQVKRVRVTSAGGEPFRGRPMAMVAQPPPPEPVIGLECPPMPEGLLYVAYPDCGVVAVVDGATGALRAGVRFEDDGTVEITDGDIACMESCGAPATTMSLGGMPDAGLVDAGGGEPEPPLLADARPVALHMEDGGRRLLVGSQGSPRITVIDLDEDGLPTSTRSVTLAPGGTGEVGVTALAVTPVMNMGGDTGVLGSGEAGEMQFIYAIATDRTVRVVEIHDLWQECDTQVDPRYLHTSTDVTFMSCMPVGDPRTPPRRAGARGPGIRLPRNSIPLDLAIAQVPGNDEITSTTDRAPTRMVGTFAFVTSSDGFVTVVNVNDDHYYNFEIEGEPIRVWMPLAIAHQIRDFVRLRHEVSVDSDGQRICQYPTIDPSVFGPRTTGPVIRTGATAQMAAQKVSALPAVRSFECQGAPDNTVHELAYQAPVEVRERAYPDLVRVRDEEWLMTWEGLMSLDLSATVVDGPPVRLGHVTTTDGVRLRDISAPFCRMGAEPWDIAALIGCDPARGNAQCGFDEVCHVHPDSTISSGMCLPADRVDQLSGACREVLITRRHYTITETHADRLVLAERRRALRTTPVDGCVDAAECEALYAVEFGLTREHHPSDPERPQPPARSWSCEQDPTRSPGPPSCQMTCTTNAECEAGWVCSGGFCVSGKLPPAECVQAVQRYQLRVGEAFAVIGGQSGFIHRRVMDPATGECIDDPDASPLTVGRLPITAPPCEGDGIDDLTPNPCSTTVEHAEVVREYKRLMSDPAVIDPVCELVSQPGEVGARMAPAIRFRNPAFTMHLVDPVITGDAVCTGDREGELPPFATVYGGFNMNFRIVAGFVPKFAGAISPAYPARIRRGPRSGLWILDQGDVRAQGVLLRGQIFRIDPTRATEDFNPSAVR